MPQEKFYDRAFIELFHHPKFIRSLLVDFIDEEWVRMIDLDSMHVEDGVHKRIGEPSLYSDLVISFDFPGEFLEGEPSGEGPCGKSGTGEKQKPGSKSNNRPKGFSLCLLLEFQSSYEPMSLRVLEYLARLYRRQKNNCLYPVIPIVIYNGIASWREKPVFEEQFALIPDSVRSYLPLYRYILIDEGRYPKKLLRKLKGAVAAFFLIDMADLEKRDEAVEEVIEVLREMSERDPEVHQLLSRYVESMLNYKGIENEQVKEYIEKRRKPMLAQRIALLKEEGRREGREEGYGQGELKGRQKSLIRQLSKKFSLSSAEEQEILSCENQDRLDEALDVILFADTKTTVLEKLR